MGSTVTGRFSSALRRQKISLSAAARRVERPVDIAVDIAVDNFGD